MEVVLTEWLSFIIRWLHVVAGIAWIGSSFYFVTSTSASKPRSGLPEGVATPGRFMAADSTTW